MIHNKTARCAAALVIGVAAVALAGCGSTGSLSQSIQQKLNGHVETVDYATGAIGKSNQNARLPSWVPDQASSLTASWWPSGQESKTDQLCGTDWYVLVQATTVYAYRPETLP